MLWERAAEIRFGDCAMGYRDPAPASSANSRSEEEPSRYVPNLGEVRVERQSMTGLRAIERVILSTLHTLFSSPPPLRTRRT